MAIALLPGAEHCPECDFDQPQKDGKCRRFIDGIRSIDHVTNLLNYIVRIAFKTLASLMAYANVHVEQKLLKSTLS